MVYPRTLFWGRCFLKNYIDDIDDNIINKLSKFADDTKLVGNVTNEDQVESMRQDLKELFKWSEDWLMMFNTEKCKVVHYVRDNA